MKRINYFLIVLIVSLSGCVTVPEDLFVPPATYLQDRKVQSRAFKTEDEIELLSAGISVLQDMGYTIDETEKKLGVITASKTVDVTDPAMQTLRVLSILLNGQDVPIDAVQRVRVSLITLPSRNIKDGFLSRITFQRIVWNTDGKITKSEAIKDEELYQEFFSKLSKSVFLEAFKI